MVYKLVITPWSALTYPPHHDHFTMVTTQRSPHFSHHTIVPTLVSVKTLDQRLSRLDRTIIPSICWSGLEAVTMGVAFMGGCPQLDWTLHSHLTELSIPLPDTSVPGHCCRKAGRTLMMVDGTKVDRVKTQV